MARRFNHEALLRARLELNLTQEQAAAALGIDVRTYRRYESGAVNAGQEGFSVRRPGRLRLMERMRAELGLAEEDLLVEAGDVAPAPAEPAAGEATDEGAPRTPSPAARPLHVHILQRARHFVGRGDTLSMLSSWAEAPRPDPGVIALVGIGGSGKTAVVERFLTSLGDAPRPGGAFVWSFYDDPRTEAFLARAAQYFAGVEAQPGERLERLQDAIRKGEPHLLVLDGLEVAQAEGGGGRAHGEIEDPLLRRLLCALARGLGGARALVTSRFELADLSPWAGTGSLTLRMDALSDGEAALLLRQWGVHGDDDALRRLGAETGGHALSLAVMGSYVSAFLGGKAEPLDPPRLTEAADDNPLARRLAAMLSAYARALPDGERDLMARLSILPSGADERALLRLLRAGGAVAGAMARWQIGELRRGLSRLERLGLVFRAGTEPPRYSTHPFLREHFRSLLGAPPTAIRAALAESTAASLDRGPRRPPRDPALLDAYEALLVRLLEEGGAFEAFGMYSISLGGFNHLGLNVGEMSRGARILRAIAGSDDPRQVPASLPPHMQAMLVYDRGLYAGALGDLAYAIRCYEAHNEIAEAQGEIVHLLTGLRTLGYTERLRGALGAAQRCVERSVALAEELHRPDHVARGVALRAAILHDLGEVDAAADDFARLREMGDQPVARRGLWEAEHLLALGRREEAAERTRANVEECARRGWDGHVAHGHVVLGLAALPEDAAAAAGHLDRARKWTAVSGEVEMILRCHELAALVALASGQHDEAEREAKEGMHLAGVCGFGLLRTRLAGLSSSRRSAG